MILQTESKDGETPRLVDYSKRLKHGLRNYIPASFERLRWHLITTTAAAFSVPPTLKPPGFRFRYQCEPPAFALT